MKKLKMTLLENSKSFLIESLTKAIEAESNTNQWKFAILSLIQSIELALKERLKMEHPILIFMNIDKKKNTVSLDLAINRLIGIVNVEITNEDIASIGIAKKWRNSITHYEFDFTIQMVKSVFGRLFSFLLDFYKHQLDEEVKDLLPGYLWDEALEIQEYLEELASRTEDRIDEEELDVITCGNCGYNTLVINDDINTCLLCGYKKDLITCDWCNEQFFEEELEEVYVGNYKGLDAWDNVCHSCIEKKQEIEDYELL